MFELPAIVFLVLAACTVPRAPSADDLRAVKVADSLVDSRALTIEGGFGQAINGKSFQQEAVITHERFQYVAYYDAGRRVCLARRELPAGDWEVIRFPDYDFRSNDAHNTISMGICPRDGTIHLAFDHHGHPLHYRVSGKGVASKPGGTPWEASLFGPVTAELEKGKPIRITYPRFLQTPDGGLQFCYRRGGSGRGDRMLVDYLPGSGVWAHTRAIDSGKGEFQDESGKSGSRCSYPNGYHYGPRGNLHCTWVWRESSQGADHDLVYVFSRDRGKTWRNNAGDALAGPPRVDSPGVTVKVIPRTLGLMNTHAQAVDSRARIHAVMWHCTEEGLVAAGSRPGEHRWGVAAARRYHHYWRDEKSEWHHRELPGIAGNRPKLFMDGADNAFLVFCDTQRHEQPDSRGNLKIMAATAGSEWRDWKVIHVERGPFVNEMLGDLRRWQDEKILSIMVQDFPAKPHDPTPLRILDFEIHRNP